MTQPETPDPNQLLSDARMYAQQAEAAWGRYSDRKAGEHALKALRRYVDLDAFLSTSDAELPKEWKRGQYDQ